MLIDLNQLTNMTSDELKNDKFLLDLKAILLDEHPPPNRGNPQDAVNLGSRIHAPFKEECFVDLKTWHPELKDEYWPTIRHSYPSKLESIVAPFRLAEGRWDGRTT